MIPTILILIIFGLDILFLFLLLMGFFLWPGYIYIHHKSDALKIVTQMQIFLDQFCLDTNTPKIKCNYIPFRVSAITWTDYDGSRARYSRKAKTICVIPAPLKEGGDDTKLAAAHEFCHYLQDINNLYERLSGREIEIQAIKFAKAYLTGKPIGELAKEVMLNEHPT